MGIIDKIEQIRQKPEHIRMRYVWICVLVSMLFVLGIWVISFKANQQNNQNSAEQVGSDEIFNQFQEQKESLKNVTEGFQKSLQQSQDANQTPSVSN